MDASGRPITYQANLANLSSALAPLLQRPQWCVWRWTQRPDGSWQKPPFIAADPARHASTKDPATWTDYASALAAVQLKQANGLTYILTPEDPFAAADLDDCRDAQSRAIDDWAQQWIDQAQATYVEVTPSGSGLRIWGTSSAETLHSNDLLDVGGRLELFRRTAKALTVSGLQLGECAGFGNIDVLLNRAAIWAKRHKAEAPAAKVQLSDFTTGTLAQLNIDQIEQIVCEGAPPGGNRSDLFHAIVGHYRACGWTAEQIFTHLEQHPDGIGDRYISEGRLSSEIARSFGKWEERSKGVFKTEDWTNGWSPSAPPETAAEPVLEPYPEPEPAPDPQEPEPAPEPEPETSPSEPEPGPRPDLPPMFCHGDPDPRPISSWLVKGLLPAVSFGLLSGQWGTGKTFLVFELSACLMTGQPFIGRRIKRQCGVMYLAAEGVSEVRKRLEAVVANKCGGLERAPFRWYEASPTLLGPNAVEKLTAMAQQADASLQAEFELPLGLIVVDTIAASAGYAMQGAESDSAIGAALMRVLQQVAMNCSCMVLGVDHFGKNIESGTRGTSSKEAASELVLACLGEKETSGRVTNTRLAIRKNRGGPQGQEYPFKLREIEIGVDEDGDPISTMVIDWETGPAVKPVELGDPWERDRKTETRQAMLQLKRVLMALLAKNGVDLPSEPDGPKVRMIDQEIAREEFYARTAAEGTEEQKRKFRNQRFRRAVERAIENQLIGLRVVAGVTYLWLRPTQPEGEF
jgi:hypothetical protein